MKWTLVGVIVGATVLSDVLQASEMRRHGEIDDFRPGSLRLALAKLARRARLGLAVALLAVSFFAFMTLLSTADLSFAVPATAATYVIETLLARYVLEERVTLRRWAGAGLVACGVAVLAL